MKKVLSLLLAMVLIVSISACGGGAVDDSPTGVANDFLKATKNQDSKAADALYDGENFLGAIDEINDEGEDELDKALTEMMKEKLFAFEYEVSNEKIDGDKATVDVDIKTYNLGEAFNEFFTDFFAQALEMAMSEDSEEADMDKLGMDLLAEKFENAKFDFEKKVELALVKIDGKWKVAEIDEEDPFFDALLGGMMSAMGDLESSFE